LSTIAFWADVRAKTQELEEVQLKALIRWREFRFPVGHDIDSLPLNFFLELFDDYLFRGALRKRVVVKWTEGFPEGPDMKGQTAVINNNVSGVDDIQIDIKRPIDGQWKPLLILSILGVLLHEMGHAFYVIDTYSVEWPMSYLKLAKTCGLTGHGPSWRKIASVIEKEAKRSFRGLSVLDFPNSLKPTKLPRDWFLGFHESWRIERDAVKDLISQGKLLLRPEELTVVFGDFPLTPKSQSEFTVQSAQGNP